MKHIIVPIDGSATSICAVNEAVVMQQAFGAEVTLLYVVADPRKEGLVEGYESMLRGEAIQVKEGNEALAKAKSMFDEEVSVHTRLEKGVVSRTIASCVADGDYDFMIMGTQGLGSALKRLLLGSVTKHVLEQVKIPVLVVRQCCE